ncbi:MAG: hypothetical protein NVS4B8_03520 [Herpetosiphon sp.]
MTATSTLSEAIDILDEGLWLYRQHWLSFLQATVSLVIPGVFLLVKGNEILVDWLGVGWTSWTPFLLTLLIFPWVLYMITVLSRMAAQATTLKSVRIPAALKIRPTRIVATVWLAAVYLLGGCLAVGTVGSVLLCTIFGLLAQFLVIPSILGASLEPWIVLFSTLVTFALLLLTGSIMFGVIYVIQGQALDRPRRRIAQATTSNLLFWRLDRNLLCFALGSGLFAAMVGAFFGSIGAGILLADQWRPILFQGALPGTRSFSSVLLLLVGILSFVVFLPPLPIWMMLLYQRALMEREGRDIERRISEWTGLTSQHEG